MLEHRRSCRFQVVTITRGWVPVLSPPCQLGRCPVATSQTAGRPGGGVLKSISLMKTSVRNTLIFNRLHHVKADVHTFTRDTSLCQQQSIFMDWWNHRHVSIVIPCTSVSGVRIKSGSVDQWVILPQSKLSVAVTWAPALSACLSVSFQWKRHITKTYLLVFNVWVCHSGRLGGAVGVAVGGDERPLFPQQHPNSVSLHGNW